MAKQKRRLFLLKENFQIIFITSFVLLLFVEVMAAGLCIYKLTNKSIEQAAFKSHLAVNSGAQIIAPIILKVNIYGILISILMAVLIAAMTFYRIRVLSAKLVKGLQSLADNTTTLLIQPYGGENTRQLIREFNHAASFLDKRQADLRSLLDSLLIEKELKQIDKLHQKLFTLLAEKNQ